MKFSILKQNEYFKLILCSIKLSLVCIIYISVLNTSLFCNIHFAVLNISHFCIKYSSYCIKHFTFL